MKVESHNLSADSGDGSRSELGDKKEEGIWKTRDQRASTDTTYYESDLDELAISPQRRREYERMLKHQEGYYVTSDSEKSREEHNRTEWERRIVETFTAQVEMTNYQQDRVQHLTQDVVNVNSFGSYAVEEVVMGLINYVAREDGRWIEDEETFVDLAGEVGLSKTELRTLRGMIHNKL